MSELLSTGGQGGSTASSSKASPLWAAQLAAHRGRRIESAKRRISADATKFNARSIRLLLSRKDRNPLCGLPRELDLMSVNPYESPRYSGESTIAATSLRRQATRSFRVVALVLLVPAVYNYWEFDAHFVSRLPSVDAVACRSANISGFVVGGALLWFWGMPMLEAISRLLRVVFAGGADKTAWQEVLYRSFSRTAYLALGGAALWGVWVFGFYEMNSNFYTISWAVGVPAHVLAACWYVPLIYRWYRLTVSRSTSGKPQNQAVNPSGGSGGS